jgi:hypothetical protein
MSLVIDSSVALAWVHADETTAAIQVVFERVAVEGAGSPRSGDAKSRIRSKWR